MKVLIAGSRDITDPALLERVLRASRLTITEVVSGGAPGVDTNAYHWALGQQIPVHVYPARWAAVGKKAGPVRNAQMLAEQLPDAGVILRWDDTQRSRGSCDMQAKLMAAGVPVFVATLEADGTPLTANWFNPA